MVTLIDIRTEIEYQVAHLKGALNIPMHQLEEIKNARIEWNAPIILYCKAGHHSSSACLLLKENGFTNVISGGSYIDLIEQFGIES